MDSFPESPDDRRINYQIDQSRSYWWDTPEFLEEIYLEILKGRSE